MGKMSRTKGANFERQIAKQMSEWLQFKVSRTPSSGAYGTREGWSSLSGDLMFAQDFPFYCELKCRESWALDDVLSGKGEFWDWWGTTFADARKHGKRPMLIAKRNRHPAYAFVEYGDTLNNQMRSLPCIIYGDVIGYRLDIVLAQVNPRLL